MANVRTFVCFEIPKDVTHSLRDLIHYLKTFGRGVRWVRHDGIHLTLKFLGDVDEAQISKIETELENIVSKFQPISVSIAGQGAFPNFQRPRVFWVGLNEPTGSVQTIQQNIEDALVSLGFEKENRRFSPHLTLGRVRFNDPSIDKISKELQRIKIEEHNFFVNEIILMKSDLQAGGAIYTPLKKIKLGS
jgi:RNA 2',3'-cyclic 3'-phosphodiesterase